MIIQNILQKKHTKPTYTNHSQNHLKSLTKSYTHLRKSYTMHTDIIHKSYENFTESDTNKKHTRSCTNQKQSYTIPTMIIHKSHTNPIYK